MRALTLALCLVVAAGGVAQAASVPSQALAVLDFNTPTEDGGRWDWAGAGVADLLQIELEQLGVATLDRDFVHALLAEQRLAADGLTTGDQLKLGALLHARHLVTGRILAPAPGRIRVEATAFSVEAIEALVTVAEDGAFPNELSQILRSVARKLVGQLKSGGTETAAPVTTYKPEALIMFYRGLNACARGRPEVGVAWFMNSSALDTNFAAPLLWEIRAYELAGFTSHARIRREEAAHALGRVGVAVSKPTNGGDRNQTPVLAVLDVAISSANTGEGVRLSATLATALKQAILATGQARLFAYEGISGAMAEQDLKLSALFARQGAPRYGRWLMADGLLWCRASEPGDDRVLLEVSVLDPLCTGFLASVRHEGKRSRLDALAATATRELIANWTKQRATSSSATLPEISETSLSETEMQEMRPAYQRLAIALNQVRCAPASGTAHGNLAGALVGIGRLRQAGEEIDRRLEALDIRAPKADLTYFGTYRWVTFDVGAARSWVSEQKINRLVEELTTHYPSSLAAGCLHYCLAVDSWRDGNWERTVAHAASGRQILDAQPDAGHKSAIEFRRRLAWATYFLEGASLFKLGRVGEAEVVLSAGREFVKQIEGPKFFLPLTPYIHEWEGFVEIGGMGGDINHEIAPAIAQQLALLAQTRSTQMPVDYAREARQIFDAENKPRKHPQDWVGCAQRIAAILARIPPQDEKLFNEVLALARRALHMVDFCSRGSPNHDVTVQPLARQLMAAVLQQYGIAFPAQTSPASSNQLLTVAASVNAIYNDAGLANETLVVLSPLFDPPLAPEFGFAVLERLDIDAASLSQTIALLVARLPGGEADVPAAIWLKLAQRLAADHRYRDALDNYRKAVAAGIATEKCAGLSATLVEAALEGQPGQARDTARRLGATFGKPGFEPLWFDWFNCGRRYQIKHEHEKAIACYQIVIEFLEHPEQTGVYHLEKQPGSDRLSLRWGKGTGDADLRWSGQYDSPWHSAAFYLAQSLTEAGRKEEAARWLRRIALGLGSDSVDLFEEVTWFSARYNPQPLGVRAADLLKQLHLDYDGRGGEPEAVRASDTSPGKQQQR